MSNAINAVAGFFRTLTSSNYTGDGITDTGWKITDDYNGHSKLTIDELYVRMKAVFESLEIKRELVTGGNQVLSCAASTISFVDYLVYDTTTQQYVVVGYEPSGNFISKNLLAGIIDYPAIGNVILFLHSNKGYNTWDKGNTTDTEGPIFYKITGISKSTLIRAKQKK